MHSALCEIHSTDHDELYVNT